MPAESLPPYRDPQLPIEQRVSDLLARMTLEEKLAQLSVSGQIDAVVDGKHSLDQLAGICRQWRGCRVAVGAAPFAR